MASIILIHLVLAFSMDSCIISLINLGEYMITLNEKLVTVATLLMDADDELQNQLGDTEECFELHCAIQNIVDELYQLKLK